MSSQTIYEDELPFSEDFDQCRFSLVGATARLFRVSLER